MASALPETPGRGRSRFSKALPTAPREESPISMKSKLRHSPLLPLPRDEMASTKSIPRRPVGAVKSQRAPSVASVSSVYSDSPGFSRSMSDSSNSRDSLSGSDSHTGPSPPLPPKNEQRQQATTPTEVSQCVMRKSPSRTSRIFASNGI